MYNAHRGVVPGGNNSRFNELLDGIRGEFEQQQMSRQEYDHKIQAQMSEMEMVRQNIFSLEQAHAQIKAKYEEEIARLTRELDGRAGIHPQQHGAPAAAPPQPPPALNASGALFGGIMSGNAAGAPGLPPQAPPEMPTQSQPPHQIPPPMAGAPPGPSHAPYASGRFVNGQAPPPSSSPGPREMYGGRGPGGPPKGPATPQPANQPYPERPSPSMPRPSPAPAIRNNLADLDIDRLPDIQKKEGADWYAVFNPSVQRVLDVDLVHTLEHHSVVCCVRFSLDGQFVATGCNRSAQIFEVRTGQRVQMLQDESVERDGDLYIRSVCFSPDGKYLATGAEDKQIRVWDIQQRTIRHNFVGHEQDIYSLDFARNGNHIASGSGDRTVRVWDMQSGQNILTLTIEDGVTTVAISPDGRFVAAGSLDKSVRVWDATTGYLVERLEGPDGHKDSVYSVAFAPNGKDLVSGSLDKTIKMWELSAARGLLPGTGPKGGVCVKTFEGHKDFVLSVALTPDGQWVLSGSKDRGVQFWDPRTANAQLMLQGHKNSVISVAPSPNGKYFATGSGDMRARIWSYEPYMDGR